MYINILYICYLNTFFKLCNGYNFVEHALQWRLFMNKLWIFYKIFAYIYNKINLLKSSHHTFSHHCAFFPITNSILRHRNNNDWLI